jgi:hypothetical protein
VDLMRRRVVFLCGENAEHGEPLARRSQVVSLEQIDVIRLRSTLHLAYASRT